MSISIWLLFSTVFIVNIGFGIILPTLPFLSKSIGANAFELGVALSVFSAAQLLGSSFWGALSDKKVRKNHTCHWHYGVWRIINIDWHGNECCNIWYSDCPM